MPVSINNTQIVFNDATVQTTAATPSTYIGSRAQVFNTSGTFTIPAGVTAIKCTVIGAGGGANSGFDGEGVGGAGGGGGAAIKWFSGLTAGANLGVTVGAGSTGTGGASSVNSGTQTITTVNANGGTAGSWNAGNGVGGSFGGQDIGIPGTQGGLYAVSGYGSTGGINTANGPQVVTPNGPGPSYGAKNGVAPGGGAPGVNGGFDGDGPINASGTSGAGRVIIEW